MIKWIHFVCRIICMDINDNYLLRVIQYIDISIFQAQPGQGKMWAASIFFGTIERNNKSHYSTLLLVLVIAWDQVKLYGLIIKIIIMYVNRKLHILKTQVMLVHHIMWRKIVADVSTDSGPTVDSQLSADCRPCVGRCIGRCIRWPTRWPTCWPTSWWDWMRYLTRLWYTRWCLGAQLFDK